LKSEILIGHKIGNKNEPVYLTKANLNYHVQLIGGSGAGKTTLIQVILKSLIPKKMGIIFVDLKADFDTIQWIKNEAQKFRSIARSRILLPHSAQNFKALQSHQARHTSGNSLSDHELTRLV
jgi:ABC-type phosphate/phosphonate transport system ATPase subunit